MPKTSTHEKKRPKYMRPIHMKGDPYKRSTAASKETYVQEKRFTYMYMKGD